MKALLALLLLASAAQAQPTFGGAASAVSLTSLAPTTLSLLAGSSVTAVRSGWTTVTGSTIVLGAYPMTDFYTLIASSFPDASNSITFQTDFTTGSWVLKVDWEGVTATTGSIRIIVNGSNSGTHYSVGNNNVRGNGQWTNASSNICYPDDGTSDGAGGSLTFAGTINRGGELEFRMSTGGGVRPGHLKIITDGLLWNPGNTAYDRVWGGCGYIDASNSTPITTISVAMTRGSLFKGHIRLYRSN